MAALSAATVADREGFGELLEQVHTDAELPHLDRVLLTRRAEVLMALAEVGAASDEVTGWQVRRTAALLANEYEQLGWAGLDALLLDAPAFSTSGGTR